MITFGVVYLCSAFVLTYEAYIQIHNDISQSD